MSQDSAFPVLLLLDDAEWATEIKGHLAHLQVEVVHLAELTSPAEAGDGKQYGMVIVQLRQTGLQSILELGDFNYYFPFATLVIWLDHPTEQLRLQCLALGALGVLHAPLSTLLLQQLLLQSRAWPRKTQTGKVETGLEPTPLFTKSPLMKAYFRAIQQAANRKGPYFIIGETGSPIMEVAHSLFQASGACGELVPYTPLFYSKAFNEQNLLHGYYQPYLHSDTPGGLMIIDFEHLHISLQNKLLKQVSQDAACNLVFTSHHGPIELALQGKLHPNLLPAILANYLPIPPLRARREDLEELFLRRLGEAGRRLKKQAGVSYRLLLQLIGSYDFPGNEAELIEIAEHCLSVNQRGEAVVDKDKLKEWAKTGEPPGPRMARPPAEIQLKVASLHKADVKQAAIHKALELNNNVVTQAAKALGYSRPTVTRYRNKKAGKQAKPKK